MSPAPHRDRDRDRGKRAKKKERERERGKNWEGGRKRNRDSGPGPPCALADRMMTSLRCSPLNLAAAPPSGTRLRSCRLAIVGGADAQLGCLCLHLRLPRFVVGGMSRRFLSPAWPSWSSADARLARLCLWGHGPVHRPPPLKALEACFWGSKNRMIFGCVFEASPHATEIISIIGPSFLTFGHLNIPRVLEGS